MKIFRPAETQVIKLRGAIELKDLMSVLRQNYDIPYDAKVRFWIDIPGGGDYSCCELDIDDERQAVQFCVEWYVKEKEDR